MPPRISWSRPEPFGAWVRLDDETLIAVDHELAARLGVLRRDPTSSGDRRDRGAGIFFGARPLELHIAVTSRCFAPCEGCYMDANPDGEDPPFNAILDRLAAARDAGVSTVALGGGEPLLRADLARIAEAARAFGLVPVMTTSGLGMTKSRAEELGAFAQINVSHDGALGGYREVRGFDGQAAAERAIEILSAAGVRVGANVTLTRSTFDRLNATAERVADLGALEIQLLRYKPGGRAASSSYADRRLSPDQLERLWPAIQGIVEAGRLRARIDCAMVPLLSTSLLSIAKDAARALSALGVFGCEAAHHLGGMRVDGTVAPCSFFSVDLERAPVNQALSTSSPDHAAARRRRALPLFDRSAQSAEEELSRFRAYHAALPEPCRSCELAAVCRGGCQVVSRHAFGALAPDPECPKVAAVSAAARASEAPQ